MRINVHIERVILDGVPLARHQIPLLRHALETEFHRLLSGEPVGRLPAAGGAVPAVAASMPAAGAGDTGGWGERIASAAHGAMLRELTRPAAGPGRLNPAKR